MQTTQKEDVKFTQVRNMRKQIYPVAYILEIYPVAYILEIYPVAYILEI